jgi:ABC-type uncharacterized transport system auxiliary subunit
MPRLIFCAVLLLVPLVTGCTILPPSAPLKEVAYYIIDPALPTERQSSPPDLVLAVQPLSSAPRYEERILHRDANGAAGYHEYDRWIEPPAEMLTQAVIKTLRAAGVARTVVDGRLVRHPDLVLEGHVTRFDQSYADPGSQKAACELELVVKRNEDGRMLLSVTVDGDVDVETTDGTGLSNAEFARAMNAAVAMMLDRAVKAIARALPLARRLPIKE